MRSRLLAAALTIAVCAAQNPAGEIASVGVFFNPRFAEDRTEGYTVQLWRQGEAVFGLLSVEALSGDAPVGELSNVKFDERSGKLSFDAKLSTGMLLMADNSQRPSRDLYRFHGAISKEILSGTMTHSDLLDPAAGETSVKIRLPKQAAPGMVEAKTYRAWKEAIDALLKVRGPKG